MTDQNANVVLTADTSGYTQSLQQAQGSTDKLIQSVDALASHLDGLTKRAGKKLVLFGAADLAALTGAVALASKYEQQTKTLSAALDKGQGSLKQYSLSIDEMARRIPAARGEIAALYTQLVQLGVKGPDATTRMADSMLKLSAVTGESVGALTDSLITLNKQMNTMASGSGAVSGFSDSLYAVSKSAGVSATGVLAFAQNLAPFARAAGIGEKSLLGISAAFNAAGADGYSAANTFNTMIADITRSIQNGSPDITKYSNLIGVTVEQFKKMDATDRITAIFDAINAQGPKAIRTLDQLGYDGIRAAKAIQGVAQSGNMRAMIAEANAQYGSGAAGQQAENDTWAGLDSQLKRISNSMQEVGANIGSSLLAPATGVARVFANILDTVNALGAPIMKIGGAMAGFTGAAAMGVGGLMTALGPLSTLAMGAYVMRSRPVRGLLGGFASGLQESSTGTIATTGMAGKMNDLYTSGRMPWYQRRIYEASRGFGEALGGPNLGGPNFLGRALTAPIRATTWFARGTADFYRQAMQDGEDRPVAFRSGLRGQLGVIGSTAGERDLQAFQKSRDALVASGRMTQAVADAEIAARKKSIDAMIKQMSTTEQLSKASMQAARALMGVAGSNLRQGMANIGGLVGRAGGLLGSLVGGVPGAVMLGGFAAYSAWSGANDMHNAPIAEAAKNPISEYNAKLGIATDKLTTFSDKVAEASKNYDTVNAALNDMAGAARVAAANGGQVTSSILQNISSGDVGAGLGFLRGMGGQLTPQNTQQVMADLINKYGLSTATQIVGQYKNGGMYGQSGNDIMSILQSAERTNGGLGRWMHGGVTQGTDLILGDISGNINAAATAATKNGTNMFGGQQVQASLTMESLAKIITGEARGDISNETATRGVAQLEQGQMGGRDIGFSGNMNTNQGWARSAAAYVGKNIKDLNENDVRKWIKERAAQDNPQLKEYLDNLAQQGIDPYMGVTKAYTVTHSATDPVVQRIRATRLGGLSTTNGAVAYALDEGYGSNKAQYSAVQALLSNALAGGTGRGGMNSASSINRTVQSFDALISAVNLSSDRLSQLGTAALQAYQGLLKYKSGDLSTQGAVMQDLNLQGAILSQPSTEANADAQNAARQQRAGDLASIRDYYKQYATMLMQFQIQTTRAEADFTLQRRRAKDDFYRQQGYAEKDFYRQRLWAQEDFNTQMARSAEEASKTVYNPWQRVYSQLTAGAATLRDNLAEQNDELSKQVSNLNKAHKLGLSEEAIRSLDLTNPQNAQQLDAIIADMIANPAFVKQINAQAAKRLALTKALTQNNDNSSYANAVADFKKSQTRNDLLFHQSMSRAQSEFNLTMTRMANDHKTAMDRAAEDLSNYNKVATGDFTVLQGIVHKFQKDLGVSNGYIKDMDAYLRANPLLAQWMTGDFGLTSGTGTNQGRKGENGGPGVVTPSSTSVAVGPRGENGGSGSSPSIPNNLRPPTAITSTHTSTSTKITWNVNNNYFTKTGPVVANNVQAIYNAINAQNKINALQGKKPNSAFF